MARLEGNVDDIKEDVNILQDIHENTTTKKCPPPLLLLPCSCEEAKRKCPDGCSGYYIITDDCTIAHQVYCYMEELCNSTGGWMRVSYLNMTYSNEKYPDEFRLYNENSV